MPPPNKGVQTMAEKRKDNKGRNLRDGETQEQNGRYKYQYKDRHGERKAVYSWRLVSTDRLPAGKRDDLSLREKEEAIANDQRDGIDGHKARKLTLNDAFAAYIGGKVNLKPSTRENYRYMYKNYVSETIGKLPLPSIKYSTIKSFYQDLLAGRGTTRTDGFKPNSLEIIHTILHPTFSQAVRDGYIRTNPTEGVMGEIKKSHDWTKPKRHALTEEQQALFIRFMTESPVYSHWLPLFTFLLGTGCRIGEALGLRWADCDFQEGTISINHNLLYRQQENGHCEMRITTPKTSTGCRTIPMLDEVRAALIQERNKQLDEGIYFQPVAEVEGYTGFIFLNKDQEVNTPHNVNRAIERIRKAANEQEAAQAKKEHREPVEIPHFSAHNLRHTFCTRFCENETNIKVIQEIMGHADISTTMNIYAEATESKKKESFANLQGKIKIS